MASIYGVDITKPVTPLDVRNAIVECFYQSHCMESEPSDNNQPINKNSCEKMVKKAFTETGGNFENPTKPSLLAAVGYLAKFAEAFKSKDIIEKHKEEIQELISLLP